MSDTEPVPWHGYADSAVVTLPPLAGGVVRRRGAGLETVMNDQRRLVIHGHFYQPPRENPWTETVPVEPSAAPAHDWNERITDESYRPNAFARILDDHGALVALVDNYRLMSFNVGPTLMSWLERPTSATCTAGSCAPDTRAAGAIAQGYSHLILPLATRRDIDDPGALGARRLRAPVRPAGRGHVAARDRGQRRGARGAGRGRRRLHDPGAGSGGAGATARRRRRRVDVGRRRVDRHPAHLSVASPERRRPRCHDRLLRRAALARRRVRARLAVERSARRASRAHPRRLG